jgi:hypothetical protein
VGKVDMLIRIQGKVEESDDSKVNLAMKMLGAFNYLGIIEATEEKNQQAIRRVMERNIGKIFSFL